MDSDISLDEAGRLIHEADEQSAAGSEQQQFAFHGPGCKPVGVPVPRSPLRGRGQTDGRGVSAARFAQRLNLYMPHGPGRRLRRRREHAWQQ